MKLFLMQATHDSPTGRKVCRHKKSSVIAFIQTSSLVKGNLDSRVRESFACESHQRLKSGIPVPLTKYPKFSIGIWNLECGIQNPGLPWIPLHWVRKPSSSKLWEIKI